MTDAIAHVEAREILSGIGRPTVEAEVATESGVRAAASSPSGTSRGRYEARELHDGGERYGGLGVRCAVENVNRVISPALLGRDVCGQRELDELMVGLDGTPDKRRLGAQGILAVSMAAARAAAVSSGEPLYRRLGEGKPPALPMPLATVLAGGKHSPSPLEFEDYMLVLDGFERFSGALDALAAARAALGAMLAERFGPVPEVGGAIAPPIADTTEAFDLMLQALERAGAAGRASLGLDIAGGDLFASEGRAARIAGRDMSPDAFAEHLADLAGRYPLTFIEDPFGQDDFERFAQLTRALPNAQVVGDDLFATNPRRLRRGIEAGAGNTILLKINQIGTVTEACDVARLAAEGGYDVAVSIRSSDTNDDFIADLAVALAARQIKLGSPVRGERNAKYNRLLKIESELGGAAGVDGGSS